MNPIIISIEGNIGAGKSTMINHIKNLHPEWNIIDEPVDSWLGMKDENGKSLLECFYENKKRWSYTFQNCAFITRYTSLMNAVKDWKENPNTKYKSNVFITERCLLTDRYVFAEMLHENGDLNELEWILYTKWFDTFSSMCNINGIVYITTEYNTCSDRIKWRSRKGESDIPINYLESLEIQHDKWIHNLVENKMPVLEITSDKEKIKNIESWIETLI